MIQDKFNASRFFGWAVLGVACLAGCGVTVAPDGSTPRPHPSDTQGDTGGDGAAKLTASVVPGVAIDDNIGVYVDEQLPPPSGAEAPEVIGAQVVMRGGSTVLGLRVPRNADALLLGLQDQPWLRERLSTSLGRIPQPWHPDTIRPTAAPRL